MVNIGKIAICIVFYPFDNHYTFYNTYDAVLSLIRFEMIQFI